MATRLSELEASEARANATEVAARRKRRRLIAVVAAVPTFAVLAVFAVYAAQSYRFQDRCGFAGPPPGTPQDQIVMSHEADLLAGELVCSWDEPQGSGSAPYGHSETVLPLFDWSD